MNDSIEQGIEELRRILEEEHPGEWDIIYSMYAGDIREVFDD